MPGLAQGGDIRLLRCRRLGATDDQKLIAAKAANDIFTARDMVNLKFAGTTQ